MIEVDISNIWGDISLPDLLGMEKDVFLGHQALTEEINPGWMNLPEKEDVGRILTAAEEIRECSDILVVIGSTAAQGAAELLGNGELELLFVPGSLSTRSRNALLRKLEGKDISLCVCPQPQLWDSLALRELKWLMERRYGTDEAHSRIHEDPFGLIAMAAAGVDIRELLLGAEESKEDLNLRSYDNPAWLYAAARRLLAQKGRTTEALIFSEPEFAALGNWWKRRFGGSIATVCDLLPGDIYITEGQHRFETMLRFEASGQSVRIGDSALDCDGLNFLSGRRLDQVEDTAWETALEAHTDAGIPVIVIQCGEITAHTVGQLLWFFSLSAALYAALAEETGLCSFETDLLRHLGAPMD